MTQTLREIFNTLERHCGKWESYFDVYETHLAKFRDTSPSVVEVGICRGGSAEMWQKYFGEGSTIVGIDIDENVKQYATPGCEQVMGNQGDPAFWEEFWKTHEDVDILIDDGGHYMEQQIVTLQQCWSHVNPGGVLIVEDTHTSYMASYGGSLRNPRTFQEYAKYLTDVLNSNFWEGLDRHPDNLMLAEFFKDLSGMAFYDSMVVFVKNGHPKNEIVTSTPI